MRELYGRPRTCKRSAGVHNNLPATSLKGRVLPCQGRYASNLQLAPYELPDPRCNKPGLTRARIGRARTRADKVREGELIVAERTARRAHRTATATSAIAFAAAATVFAAPESALAQLTFANDFSADIRFN